MFKMVSADGAVANALVACATHLSMDLSLTHVPAQDSDDGGADGDDARSLHRGSSVGCARAADGADSGEERDE